MLISLLPPPTHRDKINDISTIRHIHLAHPNGSLELFLHVPLNLKLKRKWDSQTIIIGLNSMPWGLREFNMSKHSEPPMGWAPRRVAFKEMGILSFRRLSEKEHLYHNRQLWATVSNSSSSCSCGEGSISLTKIPARSDSCHHYWFSSQKTHCVPSTVLGFSQYSPSKSKMVFWLLFQHLGVFPLIFLTSRKFREKAKKSLK